MAYALHIYIYIHIVYNNMLQHSMFNYNKTYHALAAAHRNPADHTGIRATALVAPKWVS